MMRNTPEKINAKTIETPTAIKRCFKSGRCNDGNTFLFTITTTKINGSNACKANEAHVIIHNLVVSDKESKKPEIFETLFEILPDALPEILDKLSPRIFIE